MANAGTFKKGEIRPGQGKRGPNKTTIRVRESITRLLEENVGSMGQWLDQIAQKDPGRAFQCIAGLLEYSLPKLSRQELSGPESGPIRTADATYERLHAVLTRMEQQKRAGG